ncbi:hypothetical protein E3N88_36875 [Mikania micrantha]|uniref:TIR domain-containing protein n=1 Tax=Mikania micrantha TaxID=192012 RepID=A0A5N6M511_9ASTR|nr:hypothetical protein E3N88_36875 [Mikania micrantha]
MMPYASSLTSTTTRVSKGYDVFLSFRGEDTRTGFASHLYEALIRKGIRTYKDDKSLHTGEFIAPELLEAIKTSRFAIVIISSNFATSKWCLEEIKKAVDCMEQGKLIVIPVFYHVSPSDVRHQSNCFEQGFAIHVADPEITQLKVATWRSAFAKVGAIKGFHVTPHRNESEIVSEMLRRILQDMRDASPVALSHLTKGLVGIESRVHEVIRILNIESSEVCFIGICGMSGIGKTTLAEVVFESIRNTFQASSFIGNIKDISKEHYSDLCKLQQKILDDVLKDESASVKSVKHGQTLLMTKLRDLKVIIVLDDVNHADQFMYLAGGREWFGPGTRIIVTTTNADLLSACRVNEIFTCDELKHEEALRLFCQSAFVDGHPTHGYVTLSQDIVKYAGGLPIALTVYGSLLFGKEEIYWKEILKKVQEYPHKEVLGRLEVGYVRLDRHQQHTFMYIACFLKGRDIDLVKDILTDIGLYPECGIPDLINKFLINIDIVDCVWMHDLLQQMCWEILHKESQQYNGKQIAIKNRQDVLDILSSKPKESRTIEIINQEPCKVEGDDCIDDPSCFSKMRNLKFLRISNIHFPKGLNYLSNDLRILECHLETLWEKNLDLPNLRSIDLSFSKDLTKIPDLTLTPNLVKLNLKGCTKLKELHHSVLCHKRLQIANLCGCTNLQSLGRNNMEMEALVTLLLSGCSNLEYVPEFGHNMKCLEHLYVDGTNIKKLPESLGELCNLRKLDASETSIQDIPLSIQYLKRLRLLRVHRCQLSSQSRGFLFTKLDMIPSGLKELDLSYCNLSVVPDCIGLLHRLVNLDLSGNNFTSLPENICLLSNLRILFLNNCKRLQSLPKLSIVNENTLYGRHMSFHYIISKERVDVSKFLATSNNSIPMVSCLNCLKIAENESSYHLSERILNSYLQLRTRYWLTPEAVFETVGAGSEIPLGFKLLGSDESLTHDGPWIGLVICAVVALHNINVDMETKCMVTAHVHVGEKYWRIPVTINFLAAGLENQLVFYWTGADGLQRLVKSSQKNTFKFSFSMDPQGDISKESVGGIFIADCKVQVTKFGQQYTLIDMHEIFKRLIEINQEVLSECIEEWSSAELFPLFYDYYRIIQITLDLYNDFLRLLKDASDSWLSVKVALEQIVTKSRTYNDYSYIEMLEQLNDIEVTEGIMFCDNFVTSIAFISMQTVTFSRQLNEEIQDIEKCKSMIRMAKVSGITITCIFSILATYMCTDEQLQEMKGASSYSMWLDLVRSVVKRSNERSHFMRRYRKELRIWDFVGSAVVVQELKVKMARFASFTRQSEEEMMIVINKLEKMLDNISVIIEDMRRHAHLYSLHIRKAGITLNQFIVDSNLQLSITGARFMQPNEEQQYENPVSEAITILYQATLSLTLTNLQWYRACVDDSNPIIHDNARSVKVICGPCPTGKGKSLYDIYQESVVNLGEDDNYWNYKVKIISDLSDNGSFQLSAEFMILLVYICKRTVACIRHLDEKFQELKSWKLWAKVISGLIAGFFCVMTVFMGEYIHFQWMEERTLARTWLHLIRSLSWKNPSLGELLAIDEFLTLIFFSGN